MNEILIKPFDRSGIALLSDLKDNGYKYLFNELEKEQEYFFDKYFCLHKLFYRLI